MIMSIITTMVIVNAVLIQSGDNTHSQLQLITPQSLSVIKISVSKPEKPMPLEATAFFELFEELSDM